MTDPRYEFALSEVRKCGRFLLEHESLRSNIDVKRENDYVTVADRTVEDMLVKAIHREFPEDSFYAEESGKSGSSSDRWIIDPIDGTVNFMNGFPGYTISVAFERKGEILFGMVYVPRQDLMFKAYLGGGAYLNDEKLSIEERDLHKSLILLVPPHRRHDELDEYIKVERRLYEEFSDVRSIGSAAFSLCSTSASWCAAYYERFLNLYDIAAGLLIVREAGGRAEYSENPDGTLNILSGSPKAYAKVLEVLDGRI